jgi:hypothetical protein
MPDAVVFLGAGASRIGGLPLTAELFTEPPWMDAVLSRRGLVLSVLGSWERWQRQTGGSSEEYLSEIEGSMAWHLAVRFIALRLVTEQAGLRAVGAARRPVIVRQNVDRTSGHPEYEAVWDAVFKRKPFPEVAVLTTNYDVLAERGLRHLPRPKVSRPGFHYGRGPEELHGRGYPSYAHLRPVCAEGAVPLFKLHGSISWALLDGEIRPYRDCRPGIKGAAAIVAPARGKTIPSWAGWIWEGAGKALRTSPVWIFIGYSFPEYDSALRDLVSRSTGHLPEVHLFSPNARDRVARISSWLGLVVVAHGGLPECLSELRAIDLTRTRRALLASA